MRPSEDVAGFDQLRTKYFPQFMVHSHRFKQKHVDALEADMALYTSAPRPWSWDMQDMKCWFDGRFQSIHTGVTAVDKLRFLRAANFLQENLYYVVRPPDDELERSGGNRFGWLS